MLFFLVCGLPWVSRATEMIQWNTFRTEEEASAAVKPLLADVQQLAQEALPEFIRRHWWNLAKTIIMRGHEQGVDASSVVRQAVRSVRENADNLIHRLDPSYGIAHEVIPAFQWAQNASYVLLSVKYSARWNAPGAVAVKDPKLVVEGNHVLFTASGSHSKKLYAYKLELELFEDLLPESCTFTAGSVGKANIQLRKLRSPREWVRLLADTVRPAYMHQWSERQQQLDATNWKSSSVMMEKSPYECALLGELWCSALEKCVPGCGQCAERGVNARDMYAAHPSRSVCEEHRPEHTRTTEMVDNTCQHPPSADNTHIVFEDTDKRYGYMKGTFDLVRRWRAGDDTTTDIYTDFKLYWGRNETDIMSPFAIPLLTGHPRKVYVDTHIPDGAQYIIARAANPLGESNNTCFVKIVDFALPTESPVEVIFEDLDVFTGRITGNVIVKRAKNESTISQYILYWGYAKRKKSGKLSNKVEKSSGYSPSLGTVHVNTLSSDEDAVFPLHKEALGLDRMTVSTHLIVYSKNESGERKKGTSVVIVDVVAPCSTRTDDSCVVNPKLAIDGDTIQVEFPNVVTASKFMIYSSEADCPHEREYAGHKELILEVTSPESEMVSANVSIPAEGHRFLQIYVVSQGRNIVSLLCTGVEYGSLRERQRVASDSQSDTPQYHPQDAPHEQQHGPSEWQYNAPEERQQHSPEDQRDLLDNWEQDPLEEWQRDDHRDKHAIDTEDFYKRVHDLDVALPDMEERPRSEDL